MFTLAPGRTHDRKNRWWDMMLWLLDSFLVLRCSSVTCCCVWNPTIIIHLYSSFFRCKFTWGDQFCGIGISKFSQIVGWKRFLISERWTCYENRQQPCESKNNMGNYRGRNGVENTQGEHAQFSELPKPWLKPVKSLSLTIGSHVHFVISCWGPGPGLVISWVHGEEK